MLKVSLLLKKGPILNIDMIVYSLLVPLGKHGKQTNFNSLINQKG